MQLRFRHIEKLIATKKPSIMWLDNPRCHVFLDYKDERGKHFTWHGQGNTREDAIADLDKLLENNLGGTNEARISASSRGLEMDGEE